MATIQDIKQRAQQVKDATQIGENTANRVGGVLVDMADHLEQDENQLSSLYPADATPTAGSTKPVQSGGIYGQLSQLLPMDEVPTPNSVKPVKSGGVYEQVSNYGTGYYISTTGVLMTSENHAYTTKYIDVVAGNTVYFNGFCKYIVYYDAQKSVIANRALGENTTRIQVTIPDGCAYVRVSAKISDINNAYIFDTATGRILWLPQNYESYIDERNKLYDKSYLSNIYPNGTSIAFSGTDVKMTFPYIPVKQGDVVKWDKTKTVGSYQFLGDDGAVLTYGAATSYSKATAPQDCLFRLGFAANSPEIWVSVNDVIVWVGAKANNIGELANKIGRTTKQLEQYQERTDAEIANAQSSIDGINDNIKKINYLPNTWTGGTYIEPHEGYIVTEKIDGQSGDIVYLGGTTRYALAYDNQGVVIGSRSASYSNFTLPENTVSFVVCFSESAASFVVYKNGEECWKRIDSDGFVGLEQQILNIQQSESFEQSQDAYNSLYYWEKIPKLTGYPYSLTTEGKLSSTSSYQHYFINVEEGDVVRLVSTTHGRRLLYAFLTTSSISHTAGEALPVLDGTAVKPYCNLNNGNILLGDVIVVVPTGCKAIILDFYSTAYNSFYIRRNKMDGVVSCYRDYIKDKAYIVRKKDIDLGQNADSCIFFTDYHVYNNEPNIITNYGHSPALIRYMLDNTNTDKVFFGGDVFNSPASDEDRYKIMDEFLTRFNFVPNMYSAVGNHEWRQSSSRDGRTKDFGSLAKKLEGIVTFGRDSEGNITQPYYYFDNVALKIRYFILYTPGPIRDSSYAVYDYPEQLAFVQSKISELGDDWKVVITQHIVYESTTSPIEFGGDDFALKLIRVWCGIELISLITQNNQVQNRAKIICVLSGHMHVDFCEFIDPYCISICVGPDATFSRYGVAPNGLRVWGTTSEQSFDVYHFDIQQNVIYGTKIGFGADKIFDINERSVVVGGTMTLSSSLPSVDEWFSQNEEVATVFNGVVTAVTAGRCTIIARKNGDVNGAMEYFNINVL